MSNAPKIIPASKHVLIKVDNEEEEQTASGIVLPDTAKKERQKMGKVIAKTDVRTVNEGDIVLFNPYGPEEFIFGEETFLILKEESILGTIKQKKN